MENEVKLEEPTEVEEFIEVEQIEYNINFELYKEVMSLLLPLYSFLPELA